MRRTPRDLEEGEHVPGQLPLEGVPGPPRLLSLFSGYGGLDLAAAAVLGAEVIGHAEVDPAACRVLAHRFPAVPNLGDVTAVDWRALGPVDVIAGGFPCQDVSSSGRKAGVDGGRHSGLWREMARAVGLLRPPLIVVENVGAITVRGLARVVGDLAELGYDARWASLPACAVGAPFARVRLFLTASPAGTDCPGLLRVAERDRCTQPAVVVRPEWQRRHADRLALADQRALDRWAQLLGRAAPDPVDRGQNGQPRLTPRFVEWLMGLPDGWVTDVPGIGRTDALRLLGNGVVPQQAAAAVAALLRDVGGQTGSPARHAAVSASRARSRR